MFKTLSKLFAATLITVIVLSATPIMMSARAQSWPPASPSFWVDPETEAFFPTNASVGTLFNVTVWAACPNGTAAWGVQLGFNASQLQAVTAGFTDGTTSQLFAGHSSTTLGPVIDNIGQTYFPETGYTGIGSVEMAETLLGTDYIAAANASVCYVTFNVTAVPAPGQMFTNLIDPAFGLPPDETLFILQSPTPAYPTGEIDYPNTAPCTYSYQASPPSFWVSPATETFFPSNASVGTLFNVTVWAACPNGTAAWEVLLGFNVSQLQVVAVGFSAGATSQLFAGHSTVTLGPLIDNVGTTAGYPGVGSVEISETLLGYDYIAAANASVFYVTFNVTAVPARGQMFTSLIDPAFGLPPDETLFILQSPSAAYPTGEIDYPNTAPCTYSCDARFSSSTSVACSPTSVSANSSVTCSATASGSDPTGTVAWSTSSSTGNFSQSVCTLSSGTCSTTYADSNTGYVNITASYSGDSANLPSSGSTILTVFVNVAQGTNVTVTPTNNLELTFANVTTSGFVVANATSTVPAPSPDLLGPYYVINVTASFSGNVTVSLAFDGSNMTTQEKSSLTMIQYTPIPGDVVAPFGLVDIRDIHFIAVLYGTNSTSPNWNPLADLNGDGKIDIRDVHIAAVNYGKTANWINITTYVDTTNNIVYGQTTHFSFIGIHG